MKAMAYKDPVFIVPSEEVHSHAAPHLDGDRWTFNFGAGLDPASQDRWVPWRTPTHEVGLRVLDIFANEKGCERLHQQKAGFRMMRREDGRRADGSHPDPLATNLGHLGRDEFPPASIADRAHQLRAEDPGFPLALQAAHSPAGMRSGTRANRGRLVPWAIHKEANASMSGAGRWLLD
jgi:hypothetical protein